MGIDETGGTSGRINSQIQGFPSNAVNHNSMKFYNIFLTENSLLDVHNTRELLCTRPSPFIVELPMHSAHHPMC